MTHTDRPVGRPTRSRLHRIADSAPLRLFARAGLLAYAVVHLLIAVLALQLGWGVRTESANSTGALTTLAESRLGRTSLWVLAVGRRALTVIALGFAAFAVYLVTRARHPVG